MNLTEIPLIPLMCVAAVLLAVGLALVAYRPAPPPKTQSCPDCGHIVSRQAIMCPGCGRSFRDVPE